ncbi:MAG: TIGR02266 family protein [Myxococcota bacterium]|nr:TIGR02266 family protein [Myxococcota bacterium]
MVDPNTRQGKRTPVTLKIKFKSETLEQFIERYAVDVSQGGIFIRTKEPLAVGTQMRFEFQLRDASPLIAGEGTVVWTRENDPSRPAIAPGMGVRFDRLAEGSQTVLERILAEKAKQAPQRSGDSPTKPPMFTDTPTRVAPLPVQEALLGDNKRPSRDGFGDQHTPLPKPMPFHSDAEDFDEQAFEEATKVRALDELIAQTAEGNDHGGGATAIIPPDELAARRFAAGGRADSTLADPPSFAPPQSSGSVGVAKSATTPPPLATDRDSAPGLPSPPAAGPAPRLLDTTPSPRVESPGDLGKTKLGFDAPRSGSPSSPPKSNTSPPPTVSRTSTPSTPIPSRTSSRNTPAPSVKDAPTRPSGHVATPVASRDSGPTRRPNAPAQKSSAIPLVILLLVLLAAGAAGAWFFYFRPKAEEANALKPTPGSAAVVQDNGSGAGTNGSAGKIVEANGSGSDAIKTGSNAVEPPKGPIVDTVVAASVDKAVVEIIGTDQKGPAPLTAKLEKDREYKARITAPGFAALELDIKGGQEKQTAKLVAKPRVVSVTTEPAGALIFVDGGATGHTTPHDVELTKAQAAKKSVRVTIRKAGFRQIDKMVALVAYKEEDARLIASLQEKLTVQVINRPPPPPPDRGSAGTGSAGTGSAATPPAPGSGSGATTPTPPTPGTGSAPAPTPTPTPAPGTGSAATKPTEPEPDFTKKP